jgi:hypothetical protein
VADNKIGGMFQAPLLLDQRGGQPIEQLRMARPAAVESGRSAYPPGRRRSDVATRD